MMHEFLNSDFVYNNIALLPVGLAALVCVVGAISIFFASRRNAKMAASPHTMGEKEYVQLLKERTLGSRECTRTGGPGGA
jgi:hypothetical protein